MTKKDISVRIRPDLYKKLEERAKRVQEAEKRREDNGRRIAQQLSWDLDRHFERNTP